VSQKTFAEFARE